MGGFDGRGKSGEVDEMSAFKTRIEQLSPRQRLALAKSLGSEEGERQSLAAFVTSAPDSPVEPGALGEFLRDRLPSHMVPSSIVELEELPRLPNGKTDTRSLADLPVDGGSPAQSPRREGQRCKTAATLAAIWSDVLGISEVRDSDNFFEIGGDSIMSIQIVARAREAGFSITPQDLVANQTIGELARVASRETGVTAAEETKEEVCGEFPLTPIQRWFFELGLEHPEHWNQAMLAELAPDVEESVLEEAIHLLFEHHDALRTQFRLSNGEWTQRIPDKREMPVRFIRRARGDVDSVLAELHRDMRFDDGSPLARVAIIPDGESETRTLAIILHHLIVDQFSWRLIFEDLSSLCSTIGAGEDVSLPTKTTSLKRWAKHLHDAADSSELRSHTSFWLRASGASQVSLPRDFESNVLTEEFSHRVQIALADSQSEPLLRTAHATYNTNAQDLLVTALLQTILPWANSDTLRVGLEGFGRETDDQAFDLSRTVGWFTSYFVVALNLDPETSAGGAIKAIKEQLREIRDGGRSYGMLRYLSTDDRLRESIRVQPGEEVLFNYLGAVDGFDGALGENVFRSIRASFDNVRSTRNKRSHVLEINAYFRGGKLLIDWIYNTRAHRQTTIERLAESHAEHLRRLIAHCLDTDEGGYTPSDFPDAGLDQDQLDRFLDSFG